MSGSLQDLEQKVALLQAQVDALTPVGPQLNNLSTQDDVTFPTALTTGQVLTYNSTNARWTNSAAAAGSGAAGLYATGTPVTTAVASGTPTNLDWTTFSFGTALLDLSTINTPTVLADGFYTFDITIQAGTSYAAQTAIVLTDGSYFAEAIIQTSDTSAWSWSCTAALHAGSTVEVICDQTTGGSKNMAFNAANVSYIAVTL
jgi:hypothetical protein